MVQILLSAGADPTAQDLQHARTALHTAAMANDVELVKVWAITLFFLYYMGITHFLIVVPHLLFLCLSLPSDMLFLTKF